MRQYEKKGIGKIDVFLDNNPTHKGKMINFLAEMKEGLKIGIEFHYIAPYSPKLNLVEYAIHLIRQKVLHHADAKKDLAQFENEVKIICKDSNILDKQQIINLLEHIQNLVLKK